MMISPVREASLSEYVKANKQSRFLIFHQILHYKILLKLNCHFVTKPKLIVSLHTY